MRPALKLSVTDLSVWRGEREVIQNLSFDVGRGDALILTGANGSGKTTLLRTLAGFLKPHSGRIDLETGEQDSVIADYCHYVGHLNGIKSSQTVFETLQFFAGYLNLQDDRNAVAGYVNAALERFSLASMATIPAGYLSAGQKRRLSLARLLCAPRPIWLLDEPTTSLDKDASRNLESIIAEHVGAGGIVIAATHLDLSLESATKIDLGAGSVAA